MKFIVTVFVIGVLLIKDTRTGEPGPCVLVEPHSEALCIPLEVINRAFKEARLSIHLTEPIHLEPYKAHHHHHEIDRLGIALAETTRILAKQYDLNHHQIFYLMPKLDLALTDIWKFCPIQFRHKLCELTRYRSLSGHCNNLNHPDWGATFSPFTHILPPHRPDGVSHPKDYEEGQLPSARTVSALMHQDAVVHDHAITVMLIAWGQIIDHDVTLTAETKDHTTGKDYQCCPRSEASYERYGITDSHSGSSSHHNCYPIMIPHNDPFYGHHGQHCMNFARSFAGVRADCRLGPRTAFNTISSYLDANFVYGSNLELAAELRSGKYGMLKSLPIFREYGLKDLLPPKVKNPEDGCIRANHDVFCFLAGDNRVNEQLVLTVLHTIFMREHNRIAKTLSHINPHWDDEKLFQETRHIITAIVQHITYEEFLPMILGKDVMHQYELTPEKETYWDGYDPKINPTAAEEFITSAFRFGHSLLPNRIERWSHGHRYIDSEQLSKLLRQPYDMYRPGYVDTFIMGLVNQLAQAMDSGVTEEVTTLLFKEPHQHFGMDLAAMNIQRGREHGVPGYTAYREICGLTPLGHWDDLIGVMRNETVYRYKQIYRSPHDIDLWSGGVSELPLRGSLLGPTFGCIIARQFHNLRHGDRYWYELPDLPSSFTPEQLHEIRKVKLSRLLCDNGDSVKTVQVYAMVYPDPNLNPRVPCDGLVIPRLNLEAWHENVPSEQPLSPENEYEHHQHGNYYEHKPPEHDSYLKPHKESHTIHHKDIYTQDYQTLHPPEFDPSYINTTKYSEHSIPHSDNYHHHSSYHTNDYDTHNEHYQYDTHEDYVKPNAHYSNEPVSPEYYNYSSENQYYDHNPEITLSNHQHVNDYYDHNEHSGDTNTYSNPDTVKHTNYTKVKSANVFLESLQAPPVKIVIKPKKPSKSRALPHIYPPSPFPGMDGLFSPNPGYLVRQKFTIYKAPANHPPHNVWHGVGGK